jgi:HPt (histidine-containing phosphotransfer) domain-containing protein
MMVDQELEELKREFLTEARQKVAEMQSRLDGKGDRAVFERLTYLAHQLKGSGGSYGFQRISTDAADLEKAIENRAQGESRKLDEQIRQCVDNLRAEIERRSTELAPAR